MHVWWSKNKSFHFAFNNMIIHRHGEHLFVLLRTNVCAFCMFELLHVARACNIVNGPLQGAYGKGWIEVKTPETFRIQLLNVENFQKWMETSTFRPKRTNKKNIFFLVSDKRTSKIIIIIIILTLTSKWSRSVMVALDSSICQLKTEYMYFCLENTWKTYDESQKALNMPTCASYIWCNVDSSGAVCSCCCCSCGIFQHHLHVKCELWKFYLFEWQWKIIAWIWVATGNWRKQRSSRITCEQRCVRLICARHFNWLGQ